MAEPFLAELRLFAIGFAPRGWAACEGQALLINQNQALFALLGTTYGGDGRTTFALPDLRGAVALGFGAGTDGNSYALGQTGGSETVQLQAQHLPPHAHSLAVNASAATSSRPNGEFLGPGGSYATSADATMASDAVGQAGTGVPRPNMQPYLALTWCIAVAGIFPSQS